MFAYLHASDRGDAATAQEIANRAAIRANQHPRPDIWALQRELAYLEGYYWWQRAAGHDWPLG